MCTVSYIPVETDNSFILTSNRDEKTYRATLAPDTYTINGVDLCFPKDEKAGGSWIAANNKGRLCCLLNGGIIKHEKQDYHTESRGKVLIEATQTPNSVESYFQSKKLSNVEPFTIVTVENNENGVSYFSEFIWDGASKNYRKLNRLKPYIWSSVTLYSKEHRAKRSNWFQAYLKQMQGEITAEKAFVFHSGNHSSDKEINVVMERDGDLKTVSITQVIPGKGRFKMSYTDLMQNNNTTCEI